ncbi:fungal-specific transcription factor domain-containing protein [Talaromyces proteolyticus]|uniref:Fungal-specific transcription factor domain-containing protein n=1 Tax=Talaromyces proteolyticus TaxID=1131652 RepID=A0AAD4PZ86_9EURO|nr:fungal-specific transcription factor domain-containing protein [Talaromyces proteolyticus]KAH8695414.1 fungal-specific transcription factor domain-containing protein [Talaromyces proteolyticus]
MVNPRYRSAVACQNCRRRKVRCTITVTGIPCVGCTQDRAECIVSKRRVRTSQSQHRGDPPRSETSPTAGLPRSSPLSRRRISNSALNPPTSLNHQAQSVRSPEGFDGGSFAADDNGGSSDLNQNQQEERSAANLIVASLKPQDRGASDMPVYTGESPGFSAVFDTLVPDHAVPRHIFRPSNLTISLARQDVDYLNSKGCLTLPADETCRDLLRAYFYYIHPIMPIIDVTEFPSFSKSGLQANERNLSLLWSMFFVASNFIPTGSYIAAGFSTRKEMTEAMYSRAKCVYNTVDEEDKIVRLQTALLLGFWHSEFDNHTQPWYWTGIAINLAQIMGLHRDPDAIKYNASISDRQRSLWRRLWWCCFFRDRWLSLTLGRPLRINLSDCNTPMPSVADILNDLNEVSSVVDSFDQHELPQLAECWILLLNLTKLLGDALLLSYQSCGPSPTFKNVEVLEDEIQRLNIPELCEYKKNRLLMFAFCHLHLHYQAFLITFYRPFLTKIPQNLPLANRDTWQDMIRSKVDAAASATNAILDILAREKLFTFAGPMTPPLLVPAMHIHLLNCKSEDFLTRQLGFNKLDFCMMVMKELQKIWSAASFYRGIFSEAIRQLCPSNSNNIAEPEPHVSDPAPPLTDDPSMEFMLHGDILDQFMSDSSFFNFWESLNKDATTFGP